MIKIHSGKCFTYLKISLFILLNVWLFYPVKKQRCPPTQIHTNPKSFCNANCHLSEEEEEKKDLCGSQECPSPQP